jgi:hypothetical protein
VNRKYTDEQVSKVRELAGAGKRDNQIAAELGISARAVAGLRHEHGIMAGIWHRKIVEQRTTGGGYAKTVGVLFDSVSIDGAAAVCARLSKDWGRVAVFVDHAKLVTLVASGTAVADHMAQASTGDFVGSYEIAEEKRARRADKLRVAEDIFHHIQQARAAA